MNYYYNQLAMALGLLKSNNVDLPWAEINEKLRRIAAENGPDNCDTDEVIQMHRKYRDMCLELRLIQIGELFDDRDAIPLVDSNRAN
jgi:hypothetical protein